MEEFIACSRLYWEAHVIKAIYLPYAFVFPADQGAYIWVIMSHETATALRMNRKQWRRIWCVYICRVGVAIGQGTLGGHRAASF